MAMFSVCITINKWRRCSQPDSTENHLDHGTDGNDGVWCTRCQHPPHFSIWNSDLECQYYSNCLSQDRRCCHSEDNRKSRLLQDTGGRMGVANIEQGTEETK